MAKATYIYLGLYSRRIRIHSPHSGEVWQLTGIAIRLAESSQTKPQTGSRKHIGNVTYFLQQCHTSKTSPKQPHPPGTKYSNARGCARGPFKLPQFAAFKLLFVFCGNHKKRQIIPQIVRKNGISSLINTHITS